VTPITGKALQGHRPPLLLSQSQSRLHTQYRWLCPHCRTSSSTHPSNSHPRSVWQPPLSAVARWWGRTTPILLDSHSNCQGFWCRCSSPSWASSCSSPRVSS